MAVAVNVLPGAADVALGIMAAAKALGLDFFPLLPERYDLVVPEGAFADPRRFETLAGGYPLRGVPEGCSRSGRL